MSATNAHDAAKRKAATDSDYRLEIQTADGDSKPTIYGLAEKIVDAPIDANSFESAKQDVPARTGHAGCAKIGLYSECWHTRIPL